ncbi:MAG TPA: FkbM family methyltransferase [Saprospiraceae bacterium]|nr:FkbM family methyltransferase [Saprospiraceae bacterium]
MYQKLRFFLLSIWAYFKFKKSYSQDGEDIVLQSFFEGQKGYRGFYVDVGAHHPVRFSNTWHFYKNNWRGINIDPTPGSMTPFRLLRRRDVNLEIGIGRVPGELTFYCFNEPALNTFDDTVANERNKKDPYYIIKEVKIPLVPLSDILEKNIVPNQNIDFLSIDVEGLDLEVLKSNNWEKFRPTFVLIEDHSFNIDYPWKSTIYQYLTSINYKIVATLKRTIIYRKQND